MKILVIGASGLLAKPVIRKLDEAGFELRLFSRSLDPSMFTGDYDIVRGDLFSRGDLEKAMDGCDAVHISVSTPDERKSTEAIVNMAKEKQVKGISMISGCTVRQENRWFKFTDNKFLAEQLILNSGIPYLIFRPTWFFESLELMVRQGRAIIPGRQPNPYHWVAAEDLGRMVANAYSREETKNGIYYVYGPESYRMKELLEKYCRVLHPGIKRVSESPLFIIRTLAFLKGRRSLKEVAALFAYFQKVKEPEIPPGELSRLGKPEINFSTWVEAKKSGE